MTFGKFAICASPQGDVTNHCEGEPITAGLLAGSAS
jgi:hypothetical protein